MDYTTGHGGMVSGSSYTTGHGEIPIEVPGGSGSGSEGEIPIELPLTESPIELPSTESPIEVSTSESPIELPSTESPFELTDDGEQPLELIEEQYEQPLELIEEGEVPVEIPEDECCSEKTVGGIHYYLVGTGETEVYNCLDNCIYHSENPRDVWQYCFRVGRQPVQCNDATVTPSAGHHHPTGAPMMDHHDMMEHDMMEHDMMEHDMMEHGIHH